MTEEWRIENGDEEVLLREGRAELKATRLKEFVEDTLGGQTLLSRSLARRRVTIKTKGVRVDSPYRAFLDVVVSYPTNTGQDRVDKLRAILYDSGALYQCLRLFPESVKTDPSLKLTEAKYVFEFDSAEIKNDIGHNLQIERSLAHTLSRF